MGGRRVLAKERLQHAGERRLADEAETDAGKGDAQLADRKVLVKVLVDVIHEGHVLALVLQDLDLRSAHAHSRELRDHEECVQQQQQDQDENVDQSHAYVSDQQGYQKLQRGSNRPLPLCAGGVFL